MLTYVPIQRCRNWSIRPGAIAGIFFSAEQLVHRKWNNRSFFRRTWRGRVFAAIFSSQDSRFKDSKNTTLLYTLSLLRHSGTGPFYANLMCCAWAAPMVDACEDEQTALLKKPLTCKCCSQDPLLINQAHYDRLWNITKPIWGGLHHTCLITSMLSHYNMALAVLENPRDPTWIEHHLGSPDPRSANFVTQGMFSHGRTS